MSSPDPKWLGCTEEQPRHHDDADPVSSTTGLFPSTSEAGYIKVYQGAGSGAEPHVQPVVSITERRAQGIVNDLATAGHVVKTKKGRGNGATIQSHRPLREGPVSHRTVGELLHPLAGTDDQLWADR